MNIIRKISQNWKKKQRKRIIRFLETTNPDVIKKHAEGLVLPAFKRAYERVPVYSEILNEHNVSIDDIKNLEDFQKKIPILTKENTFGKYKLHELCLDGNLDDGKLFLTSSGFSGLFSFGVFTGKINEKVMNSLDTALEIAFNSDNKKTLIINALPMGVKFETSCYLANTSVREDMVHAYVKNLGGYFDLIIVVSDPHFVKYIIETGINKGIDWKKTNVSFVAGEDWTSNSYKNYILSLINYDSKNPRNKIFLTMGITELDLNLFHETERLINIREACQKNRKLFEQIFGKEIKTAPELMYYYPQRTYLEILNPNGDGFGELVFSMLSPDLKVPFMRYNSKDYAKLINNATLKEILVKNDLDDLVPDLKLPLVCIYGRLNDKIEYKEELISVCDIKEAIYSDTEIAANITGYFKLSLKNEEPLVEIQLKEKTEYKKDFEQKVERTIEDYIGNPINVKAYEYLKFPYGLKLDYEKKFKFI